MRNLGNERWTEMQVSLFISWKAASCSALPQKYYDHLVIHLFCICSWIYWFEAGICSLGVFECCFQYWQKGEQKFGYVLFPVSVLFPLTPLFDFTYSAPAVLTSLSPRSQKPVLDQAGRWPEDFTVGFSHTQSSGTVVSKVGCARQSIGVWAGC